MSPLGLVLIALGWSAAVWAGASLICRMKPAPKLAQAIWRGAALVMIAPFAASLVLPGLPVRVEAQLAELPLMEPLAVAPTDGAAAAAPSQAFQLPDTGTLILGVIAAGWAVRFLLWGISQVRLQRLKARAMRTNRPIGHWAEAVGLSRTPKVHVIPRGAPFLAGILKRSVYVPAALINGAGASQVIVHELVHLKRGDLATRPLERVIADVFWFSPFAWWIRGQLDFWREAVVDDETVELTGDRIAYARTLTSAARVSRDEAVLPVAAFILRKKGTLKMRLNELLTEKTRPRRLGLVLAAALVCAAPLAVAQGMLIKGAAAAPGADISYGHAVLDKARLTSAFGVRKHPITGEKKTHYGVDLAEAEGVPVYAPSAGVITSAAEKGAYGNLVEMQAGGETVLRFAQLDSMKVSAGDTVKAGDLIGTLGQSGRATGPHLHFEVWRGGAAIDPQAEEGLVLADRLFITSSSGATAPKPPEPPVPPAPSADTPKAPAPPAPPQEFIEKTSADLNACEDASKALEAMPMPAAWTTRKEASRQANRQTGLFLPTDWTPDVLAYPRPAYPAEAAAAFRSGVCKVMFDLGTDGLPKNMLAECSDPVFAASAAELKGARFEPAIGVNGEPVEVKGVTYPLQYCIEA
jgi:murein DD-endopeptidase MepM/ murein hydrolase activator NlpD